MMNENERLNSPKNRWTRWYMWLAYGGGTLGVTAVVVVIMTMSDAPSRDEELLARHHNTPTLPPHEAAALIRQHASINSPAEVNDLQFIAIQEGITLDESIMRYAWRDDFSSMTTAIEDEDPDSVVDAGSGKPDRFSAWIKFSGSISGNARDAIDKFQSENPHVTVSLQTGKDPGFTKREAEEAVIGAHFAVMEEDGVQDAVTYYDSDAIEIVVTVRMATPPSGEKLSSLEKAAERGAAEATRPDITDSLTISLSVVQHDLSGTDRGAGADVPRSFQRSNAEPGLRLPRGLSEAMPGADVAMGVTAYQLAASTRAATTTASRGRTLANEVSRLVTRELEEVIENAEGVAEHSLELARHASRGSLEAAEDLSERVGEFAGGAVTGSVRTLSRHALSETAALQGAGYGVIEGTACAGLDLDESVAHALMAAREVSQHLEISEDQPVAAPAAGVLDAAAAEGAATLAAVRDALPGELLAVSVDDPQALDERG